MPDDFSPELIESCLTGTFGRPLRYLDSVGSTNTEAMGWALDGAPHGAVVTADHQTEGRGRWGRSWFSKPGALLQLSLVLRPDLPVDTHGLLTAGLGVATAEAIEDVTGLRTKIKWPNDVTVAGKKVVGMLVETAVEGSRLAVAICGIGINVHLGRDDLPEEIKDRASSIAVEMEERSLGPVPSRAKLLCALLAEVEKVYQWIEDPAARDRVIDAATRRSEVLGKDVVVRLADGSEVTGAARSLDASGALIVDGLDGEVALHVGEISQLRDA
jgi:BirA family biotin operon repressor/biotin-[acetyl-CoA-carboxylase] ligase